MRLRLAVLALFLVVAPTAYAATITVNTTSSTVTSGDGFCSLVEAIDSAGGLTVPDCVPGDLGIDDIVLPAGTILDGGTHNRVLTVFGTVEARGLTLTNGRAADGGVDGDGLNGGGILMASGASLTLADCAITNNVAGHGGQGANETTTFGDLGG